MGNGSLGYSKFICLGRETHAKGILRRFYDFTLKIKGSHWDVFIARTLLSKFLEKLVGLKGLKKGNFAYNDAKWNTNNLKRVIWNDMIHYIDRILHVVWII